MSERNKTPEMYAMGSKFASSSFIWFIFIIKKNTDNLQFVYN